MTTSLATVVLQAVVLAPWRLAPLRRLAAWASVWPTSAGTVDEGPRLTT